MYNCDGFKTKYYQVTPLIIVPHNHCLALVSQVVIIVSQRCLLFIYYCMLICKSMSALQLV